MGGRAAPGRAEEGSVRARRTRAPPPSLKAAGPSAAAQGLGSPLGFPFTGALALRFGAGLGAVTENNFSDEKGVI